MTRAHGIALPSVLALLALTGLASLLVVRLLWLQERLLKLDGERVRHRALVEAVKSGATDRESLAAALPKVAFTGPRGELRIDPATNNIVQPIHVYETVAGADGLTQKVLATLPAVADPVNGCQMADLN